MSQSLLFFYFLISICLKISFSISSPPTLCLHASWNPNGTIVASNLSDGYQQSLPSDFAIDSQENLIIADWQVNRLLKYSKNGTIKTLVSNVFTSSVFVDRFDNIYFTNDTMVKMLSRNGSLKIVAGTESSGSAMNQLKWASGIYVNQKGVVYVADGGNFRVMKWEPNATEGIVVAGGNGQGANVNQLFGPKCLFVDELNNNTLYVCDVYNYRIQKFIENSPTGITVLSKSMNSILDFPSSIYVDSNGIIYVSQDKGLFKWFPNIQRTEVILIGHIGDTANRFRLGSSFKFDKNWNIFLEDMITGRILKYLFKTTSCATGK